MHAQMRLKAEVRRIRDHIASYLQNLRVTLTELREFLRNFPEQWVERRPKSERRSVGFVIWLVQKIKKLRAQCQQLRLLRNRADWTRAWKAAR